MSSWRLALFAFCPGLQRRPVCHPGSEDTITLLVQWKNLASGFLGTAVYTASWAAPKADVHSQQRFHFMAHKGEAALASLALHYRHATAGLRPAFAPFSSFVTLTRPLCATLFPAAGELNVDQAHRGYQTCTDDDGFKSVNPLYMAYMPGTDGNFNGALFEGATARCCCCWRKGRRSALISIPPYLCCRSARLRLQVH